MSTQFLSDAIEPGMKMGDHIRRLYDDQVLDDDQGAVVDYDQASLHLLRHLVAVAKHANTLHWHQERTTAAVITSFMATLQALAIDATVIACVDKECSAEKAVAAVAEERRRQDEIHGAFNAANTWNDWTAILAEEIGETAELGPGCRSGEFIHVAAVAVAMVEQVEAGIASGFGMKGDGGGPAR